MFEKIGVYKCNECGLEGIVDLDKFDDCPNCHGLTFTKLYEVTVEF